MHCFLYANELLKYRQTLSRAETGGCSNNPIHYFSAGYLYTVCIFPGEWMQAHWLEFRCNGNGLCVLIVSLPLSNQERHSIVMFKCGLYPGICMVSFLPFLNYRVCTTAPRFRGAALLKTNKQTIGNKKLIPEHVQSDRCVVIRCILLVVYSGQ